MNIFILDEDPILAAKYHADNNLNQKINDILIILKNCRIISKLETVPADLLMRIENTPILDWVLTSSGNYNWLYELLKALIEQLELRTNKPDAVSQELLEILREVPEDIPDSGITCFPDLLPEAYQNNNIVEAHREYYIDTQLNKATWTDPAGVPAWIMASVLPELKNTPIRITEISCF